MKFINTLKALFLCAVTSACLAQTAPLPTYKGINITEPNSTGIISNMSTVTTGTKTPRKLADRNADYVNAADYGVVCDGVTDNYTALTNMYAAISSNKTIVLPNGLCIYKTPMVFAGKRISWRGAGSRSTILVYSGTNATSDLITFGNNVSEVNGITISNLGFMSYTQMAAGACVRFYKLTRSVLDNVLFDHQDGTGKFYIGVWFDGVDFVTLDKFQARGTAEGLRVNGNGGLADLFISNGKIAMSAIGIHIAGSFGGFYLESTDVINNGTNVLVDKSVTGINNREIIFGPGAMIDTASIPLDASTMNGVGVDVQDSGGFMFFNNTWVASGGSLLRVGSGYSGTIMINGGFFIMRSPCQVELDGR